MSQVGGDAQERRVVPREADEFRDRQAQVLVGQVLEQHVAALGAFGADG
jgi:hypothetical protein